MRRRTAADIVEQKDPEVRVLMAELVEFSGKLSQTWANAVRTRDDESILGKHLADSEVLAADLVGYRLRAILRTIRSAARALSESARD
jgi:hypothetical protein